MFDFNMSVQTNANGRVLLCAHRGVSSANIPCNTMAAFKAALAQKADIIELDVSISTDGVYYVFHPGMESPHLGKKKLLSLMPSKKIEKRRFMNQDDTPTEYGIEKLEDVLDFLKGKCYINVDKFWTDIPGIADIIRKCGVEKQVIVKTPLQKIYFDKISAYAPEFMYMPIIRGTDKVTDMLLTKQLNYIGAEVCFSKETDQVAQDSYIQEMHKKGLLLFSNAIVYDYKEVLSAGHSDDASIINSPDFGWGWLANKGYDIIQTDWCGMARHYFVENGIGGY